MMPDMLSDSMRYLIIVAREHADLLPVAERRFAGDVNVEVFVDRRMDERRREPRGAARERRRRERRAVRDFWADLRFHPVVLATRREPVDVEPPPLDREHGAEGAARERERQTLREILGLCERALSVLDEIRTRLGPRD